MGRELDVTRNNNYCTGENYIKRQTDLVSVSNVKNSVSESF